MLFQVLLSRYRRLRGRGLSLRSRHANAISESHRSREWRAQLICVVARRGLPVDLQGLECCDDATSDWARCTATCNDCESDRLNRACSLSLAVLSPLPAF